MSTTTTPVRHVRAGVVASWRSLLAALLLTGSGLAVALLVASPVDGSAGTTATALGAAGLALAGVALTVVVLARTVLVHPDRLLLVGGRDLRHRESLDSAAEPAHPLTPGRRRSRAPGRIAPAA